MRAFRLGHWAKAARFLARVVRLDGALRARARRYLARIPQRSGARTKVRVPATRAVEEKSTLEGTLVRRTPHMDLEPATPLARGGTLSVDVFADTAVAQWGEDREPIPLRGRPGQTRFELDVWLAGSAHFRVEEPKASTLVIDVATDNSTRARFTVSVVSDAAQDGIPTLTAYFFCNGRPCGKVSRRPQIGAGPARPAAGAADTGRTAARGSLAIDPSARPPDLTVEITDPTRNRRSLQCRVTTPLLPAEAHPPIADWLLPEESASRRPVPERVRQG